MTGGFETPGACSGETPGADPDSPALDEASKPLRPGHYPRGWDRDPGGGIEIPGEGQRQRPQGGKESPGVGQRPRGRDREPRSGSETLGEGQRPQEWDRDPRGETEVTSIPWSEQDEGLSRPREGQRGQLMAEWEVGLGPWAGQSWGIILSSKQGHILKGWGTLKIISIISCLNQQNRFMIMMVL